MGHARGKIVVVRDFTDSEMGIPLTTFDMEDSWNLWQLLGGIGENIQLIKRHFKQAANDPREKDKAYMTFTSCSCILRYLPRTLARAINPIILEEIKQYVHSRLGFIIMDFPSEEMVEAVIEQNLGRNY